MRIAFIAQEYPPETAKGGIGTQTYLKAHGMAARGHTVHVISRSATGQRTEQEDGPVRVTRIPGTEKRMAVHTDIADWLGYSNEVAVTLAELHAAMPFDLAEFPEWSAEAYVHLLNRTAWNYLPTIIQLHGPLVMFAHALNWPDQESEFYRIGTHMEGTCLRLADGVFSSSHCSAEWVARHYGLSVDAIPVMHAGVDTRVFYPRPRPQNNRPTILFAGKIVRNKGVVLLTKAVVELAAEIPGLQLRLIGRGEDSVMKEIRQLAARAPNDLVDFRGFVPREALPEEFAQAHAFAVPSRYEGGPGFGYLEAMACGLPVIACQGSGSSEAVAGRGLLIPPDDLEALKNALRILLLDGKAAKRMSVLGLEFVLSEAESERCLDRIESFYAAIVSGRTRRMTP